MRSPRLMTAAVAAAVCMIASSGCALYWDPGHGMRVGLALPAPGLTLIAGTGISWAPAHRDVFYYGGGWYWVDGPYWYRSSTWGGNWTYVARPPNAFKNIPYGHRCHQVVFRHPGHPRYNTYRHKHYRHYQKPAAQKVFKAPPAWGLHKPHARPAQPAATHRVAPTQPAATRRTAPVHRRRSPRAHREKRDDDKGSGKSSDKGSRDKGSRDKDSRDKGSRSKGSK